MSAWIGIDTYTDFFGNPDSNLQGGVCYPLGPLYFNP